MENIEAMLCAYVEGDLDAAGRVQIEKHLQDHPQHRKLLEELIAMRELVRSLPRAKAPTDVGDSLRQKVERSMLLEDSPAAVPSRQSVDRWPQFFGIAAIFLLVASLCFILYKALGPTWKPAVFTQNVDQKIPDLGPVDQTAAAPESERSTGDQSVALAMPSTTPPAAVPTSGAVTASPPPASTILKQAQNVVTQSQQQALSVAQVDIQAIRRRLENSGYGIHNGNTANSAPMLMVVNSTDLPATKAQITQFMSSNSGISWNAVPAVSQAKSDATTMPSYDIAGKQMAQAQNGPELNDRLDLGDANKVMSSDLYVARGLTPERADALRQTLAIPQNGSQVQVTVQSAAGLATTEPSVVTQKDVNVFGFAMGTRMPTSQPAESADNRSVPSAGATTAPSPALAGDGNPGGGVGGGGGVLMANNNATPLSANQSQSLSQSLPPVDAVIVLQSAVVAASPAVPTTQPASPSTQP
jgi:anti-sigma factor RsiW